MITFLEFMDIVKGYHFSLNGKQVFNYQLFHRKVDPTKLIFGRTEYEVHFR